MRDKQKEKETLHNNHVDKQTREREPRRRKKHVYLIPTKLNLTDI
jgi:hypothetical protein